MKFLIFNLVVAGALIYLFFAGQPEPQTIADEVDQQLQAQAQEQIREQVQEQIRHAEPIVPELSEPTADNLRAGAQPKSTTGAASAADLETQLAGLKALLPGTAPTDEPLPPPPPVPAQWAPESEPATDAGNTAPLGAHAQANRAEASISLAPVESVTPEVAVRRALVLRDSEPAAPPVKPASARRQELQQLSEEMELIAVEALAQ